MLNQALGAGTGTRGTANHGNVGLPFGEVSLEDIFQVIDSLENRNYTFSVDDLDEDPFTFTNLVIKKREDGSIDPPYLLMYEVDSTYQDGFLASGFAMDRFTGVISKRYLQSFSTPQLNTANLGERNTQTNGPCDYDSRASGGEGVIGEMNNPGSVDIWSNPAQGTGGYLRCVFTVEAVQYRCHYKADLGGGWTTCTKYVTKTNCYWVTRTMEVYDGTNCPEPEPEEVAIHSPDYIEFVRNLRLDSMYDGMDFKTILTWLWQGGLIEALCGWYDSWTL